MSSAANSNESWHIHHQQSSIDECLSVKCFCDHHAMITSNEYLFCDDWLHRVKSQWITFTNTTHRNWYLHTFVASNMWVSIVGCDFKLFSHSHIMHRPVIRRSSNYILVVQSTEGRAYSKTRVYNASRKMHHTMHRLAITMRLSKDFLHIKNKLFSSSGW